MEITVLIDNEKERDDLRTEHGLSVLIEAKNYTILFDTGKSDAFIQNAKTLNKDLTKVDFVILSHAHYDHTGGLESFLSVNNTAKIIMKRDALQTKISHSTGYYRDISLPIKANIKAYSDRIIWADEAMELFDGFYVLPDIKRSADHSFTDSFLFVEKDKILTEDKFSDELFIAIVKDKKLIILTGCAHNGIENMINTAIDFTGINQVELIIGGTHLNRASAVQVEGTIEKLKEFNITKAAFNHCSGKDNIPALNEALPTKVEYGFTGNTYIL